MLRRPFCGMAVCFLLGVLSAAYLKIPGRISVFGGAILMWIVLLRFSKHIPGKRCLLCMRITVCFLMIGIGFGQYEQEQLKREQYLPELTDGMSLTVQGKVAEKQLRNHQYIYELTSCLIGPYQFKLSAQEPVPCNRILAYSNSDIASIGETLVLNGTVELWENAVNEGNFDECSFYLARKIDFALKDIHTISVHGKACVWKEYLFCLRFQLKEVYRKLMTPEAGGIMSTMVLGDKTLLDAETKRLYQIAGLSHMMAISGLHISVIGMSLYKFLRGRGLGFGMSGAVVGLLLYAYGTMVGMGTSVQRSVGMFAMFLFAQTIGRAYDSLNALGLTALVLLWRNPYLLWDAGFQFSFIAILGVVWIGGCVSFETAVHEKTKQKLFLGASVLVATLPLAAWHYYEAPLYAMMMNFLVLPFMGVLLVLGVAGGMMGLLSLRGAAGILFPCEKLLELVRGLCEFCEKLPQSMVIVGRPELWQVICYYAGVVLLVLWAYRRKKNTRTIRNGATEKRVMSGRGRQIAGSLMIVCILFFILTFPASGGLELDILDVGQGDGAFFRTEGGNTVFVDGGSSNIKQVGTYRILPFLKYKGVRRIDFWFISHTDEDHISGLREILEAGYEVAYLIFAEGIVRDDTYEELRTLAEKNDTQILFVTAGDTLHLRESQIHVLYPQAETDTELQKQEAAAMDKNASSLVFIYEEKGFTAIFTGDVGSEQEHELTARLKDAYESGKVTDVSLEVYKAAHHGSKYSNSEELLDFLQPEIATVSCAKKNNYGHPGAEAIAHMEKAGSEVFYTMESGQITVNVEDGEIKVYEYVRK